MKRLKYEALRHRSDLERFFKEAAMLKSLRHRQAQKAYLTIKIQLASAVLVSCLHPRPRILLRQHCAFWQVDIGLCGGREFQ